MFAILWNMLHWQILFVASTTSQKEVTLWYRKGSWTQVVPWCASIDCTASLLRGIEREWVAFYLCIFVPSAVATYVPHLIACHCCPQVSSDLQDAHDTVHSIVKPCIIHWYILPRDDLDHFLRGNSSRHCGNVVHFCASGSDQLRHDLSK